MSGKLNLEQDSWRGSTGRHTAATARRGLFGPVSVSRVSSAPSDSQRVVHRRARHADTRQADVIHDRVRVGGRKVPNIHAARGRISDRDLNGRISRDDVPADQVACHDRGDKDAVGVAGDDVVNDDVLVRPRAHHANAEVVLLSRIAISAQPVRTEPVPACAGAQSYAAARSAGVPIPHGDVAFQLVVERRSDKDSREAIRRNAHQRDEHTRASCGDLDPMPPEPLDDAWSLNDIPPPAGDQNPALAGRRASVASCRGVRLARQREPVQLQRQSGPPERDTRRSGHSTCDVADELTIVGDRQRG